MCDGWDGAHCSPCGNGSSSARKGQLQGRRRAGARTDQDLSTRFGWPPCLHQLSDILEEIPCVSSREHCSFQGGIFTGSASVPLFWGPLDTFPSGTACICVAAFLRSCNLSWKRDREVNPSCLLSLWPLVHSLSSPCVAVVFAYQKSIHKPPLSLAPTSCTGETLLRPSSP